MKLSELMREARESLGMTRPQMAAVAGVHPSLIARMELNDVVPETVNLIHMADAVGVRAPALRRAVLETEKAAAQ